MKLLTKKNILNLGMLACAFSVGGCFAMDHKEPEQPKKDKDDEIAIDILPGVTSQKQEVDYGPGTEMQSPRDQFLEFQSPAQTFAILGRMERSRREGAVYRAPAGFNAAVVAPRPVGMVHFPSTSATPVQTQSPATSDSSQVTRIRIDASTASPASSRSPGSPASPAHVMSPTPSMGSLAPAPVPYPLFAIRAVMPPAPRHSGPRTPGTTPRSPHAVHSFVHDPAAGHVDVRDTRVSRRCCIASSLVPSVLFAVTLVLYLVNLNQQNCG